MLSSGTKVTVAPPLAATTAGGPDSVSSAVSTTRTTALSLAPAGATSNPARVGGTLSIEIVPAVCVFVFPATSSRPTVTV